MEANKEQMIDHMTTDRGMLTKEVTDGESKKHNQLDRERSIKILNSFIELNNDRIAGYDAASIETREADLTALFILFSYTSRKCSDEMTIEVLDLGGVPTTGFNTHNHFFKAYQVVKVMPTAHNREAILTACLHGEDMLHEAYQNVLSNALNDISDDLRNMLNAQHDLLKTDRDKVKSVRTLMLAHL